MHFETRLVDGSDTPYLTVCMHNTRAIKPSALLGVAGESSPAEGVAAYWGGIFVAALSRFSLDTRSRAGYFATLNTPRQ